MQKQLPKVSYKKAVHKNFTIFTVKYLCWSLLIRNIAKVLEVPILKNIWERLHLKICSSNWEKLKIVHKEF